MSIKLSNLKPAAIFPVLNVRESYVSELLVDEVPKSVYSENWVTPNSKVPVGLKL